MDKARLRQSLKSIMQKCILPPVYFFSKIKKVDSNKVIFADSNTDALPESMQLMYERLKEMGYDIHLHLCDIRKCGALGTLKFMVRFMKDYATARAVFICNYFVPATACKKRKGTDVIQLWHSCGLLKKFAYDTSLDISPYFKGSVTKNTTLITVSSEACVPVFEQALKLQNGIVKATGVSRTDCYFDEKYNESCKAEFYSKYPQYRDKRIALWAPTFRGTAANPVSVGQHAIENLQNQLGNGWAVIIKQHPHIKDGSNCDIPTSRLFPVADILISDYSSLILEYIIYRKPFMIYAPDYDEYTKERGFYVNPDTYPCSFVTDENDLYEAVKREYSDFVQTSGYDDFVKYHVGACDGFSTDRIIKEIFL